MELLSSIPCTTTTPKCHRRWSIALHFAPGQDLHHSLRWRDGTLRLVNWDPHSAHGEPVLNAMCTAIRKRQLLLLACVVREGGGTWGIARSAPASEGTKVWVDLPGGPGASGAGRLR